MVRSKLNQCESWFHSVVVEIGSIQVVVKTLACVSWHLLRTLFKELRSPAIDLRVAGNISQEPHYRRSPLASRQKLHFVQF